MNTHTPLTFEQIKKIAEETQMPKNLLQYECLRLYLFVRAIEKWHNIPQALPAGTEFK